VPETARQNDATPSAQRERSSPSTIALPPPPAPRGPASATCSQPRLSTSAYLTWTADGLLRHTVYLGLREDKPPEKVRREAARVR
jgi:ATP-dependent DNA ligase